MMFLLRDLPKYPMLEKQAERFPELDVSASLACLALLRVGSDVLKTVEQNLALHRLSQGKFVVLMLLHSQPEKTLSPSEIAARSDVTRTNITGLLNGLENTGDLERTPHPEDRRALCVRLTEKGEARLAAILPDFYQRIGQMMQELSEEERKTLISLLAKVRT